MSKIDLSLAAIEKDLRTPYVKTEKDILRELGYTLKFLGGGIFRNVYKNRRSPCQDNRIGGGNPRHRRCDNLIPRTNA